MSDTLPQLSRHLFPQRSHPLRVLQFGSGVFLRGFVDWMLDLLREQGLFDGSVTVLNSHSPERLKSLQTQEGLYTLHLEGRVQGKPVDENRIISVIEDALCPEDDFSSYLRLARQATLGYIVSNTTETGIVWQKEGFSRDRVAASFPARLTQFLYHRFEHFGGDAKAGLIVLPCELIEANGQTLKALVLRHAQDWQLPPAFADWLKTACVFYNTLVDRIVTGRPTADMAKIEKQLGYRDALYNTAEAYHFWALEGREISGLPFCQAGLQVLFTKDLRPYRERKVRILNGTHTLLFAIALLLGQKTVRESLQDEDLAAFLKAALRLDILPHVPGDLAAHRTYAAGVLERFQNEALHHEWQAIALNSVAKFKERILPSLQDGVRSNQKLPPFLTFSLAALCYLYRGEGFEPREAAPIRTFFKTAWDKNNGRDLHGFQAVSHDILANTQLWGQDLTSIDGLSQQVAAALRQIEQRGLRKEVQNLVQSQT